MNFIFKLGILFVFISNFCLGNIEKAEKIDRIRRLKF